MNEEAKRYIERFESEIEVFLNEQRAELATYSAILQCFVLNLARRGGPEGLASYRDEVVATLGRMQPGPDPAGDRKMILMTQDMAKDFFDRIAIEAGFDTSGKDEGAN